MTATDRVEGATLACVGCGAPFVLTYFNRATKRYCSRDCRKQYLAPVRPPRPCRGCGVEFVPPHATTLYCSDDCRRANLPKRFRAGRQRPRSRTLPIQRTVAQHFAWLFDSRVEAAEAPAEYDRPRTRGDCVAGGINAARPCPFVSCRHHLFLDVVESTGSLKLHFPEVGPWDLVESCALDVADDGGRTLEDVGLLTNVTRERLRQIELAALHQLKTGPHGDDLAEMLGLDPTASPDAT